MSTPVRIDDQLYEQAKAHALAERRSIAGQIEFWAMVGKAALDNPAERARLGANARQFAQASYDLQTVCLPKQLAWVEGLAS